MIKHKPYLYLIPLLLIFLLSSCANERPFVYFQKQPGQSDTMSVSPLYIPRIHTGDILSIPIASLSPDASSFFNPFTLSGAASALSSSSDGSGGGGSNGGGGGGATAQASAPGYLVDANGNIEMPLIGQVKLDGLTTIEAAALIKTKLSTYLKEPTVIVRFLNYKISVTGEVSHPSVYVIPNEMITLPEALSMAGDLTAFANRDNVQIIRDVNGKKVFGTVNLNSRDVFNSPYYYLHANDLVYVAPSKRKAANSDRTYLILPSIVSFLSLVVVIFRK